MERDRATRMYVLAAVEDIFFSAKIESVSRGTDVELKLALNARQLDEALHSRVPDLIVIDLNSKTCEPLESIRRIRADSRLSGIRIIGFLSHVQVDLGKAAREAGCDHVLPRSAFSKDLQKILSTGQVGDK